MFKLVLDTGSRHFPADQRTEVVRQMRAVANRIEQGGGPHYTVQNGEGWAVGMASFDPATAPFWEARSGAS